MNKKTFLGLIAAAALLFPYPVQAQEATTPAQVVYTTDCVNVREKPSLESEVLFTLDCNTPVWRLVDGQEFDLVLIENQPLFIHGDFLSEDQAYTEEDFRLLTSIIFEEAGNQCLAGQQAVGIVVINRVKSSLFPNNIYDVLWEYNQFFNPSCIGFYESCLQKYDDGEIPESCYEAARYVLNGNTYVYYNDQYLDLSNILFFARYRSDCKIEIQDHNFS